MFAVGRKIRFCEQDGNQLHIQLSLVILDGEYIEYVQVAIGSNLLESGNTFSQLAHNTSSLVSFNTVPGNAYTMVTPLLAQAGEADAAAQGISSAFCAHGKPFTSVIWSVVPAALQKTFMEPFVLKQRYINAFSLGRHDCLLNCGDR